MIRPLQAAEKGLISNEKAEKHPSGAKARVDLIALASRLKSCPVTKRIIGQSQEVRHRPFPQPV
jgi:hypothetical protein